MKRILKSSLSLLLAITIIFSSAYVGLSEVEFSEFFAVKAKAATVGDLTFTLNEDGKSYSVTDCDTSASGTIAIPDKYNGLPVTSIGVFAFLSCYSLTSITIGETVTSIGDSAFHECYNLTSVTIGENVRSIGSCAFVFCMSLTSITIPDSVTSIGDGVFACCSNLISINVDSENMYYTSVNGVLFNKNKTTLVQYPAGKTETSYVISDSVTSIGDGAFAGCYSLTSTTFPDSVTSIGASAFYYCTSLTSITIPNSVTSIGNNTFSGCSSLSSIIIPDSVTSIDSYAFYDCTNLTIYGVQDSFAETFAYNYSIPFLPLSRYDIMNYKDKTINDTYTINVKVLNKNKSEEPAVGAYVTVYLGKEDGASVVCSEKTDASGNVTFNKSELISRGVREDQLLECTVSAHFQLGNDFELCSEYVNPNGVWIGASLINYTELIVDEPRWKPLLSVLINESNTEDCKKVLKDYSKKFAQSTNGHVIINGFDLTIVPDSFSTMGKDFLVSIVDYKDIDICMIKSNDTSPWSNVSVKDKKAGGLDNNIPGYSSEYKDVEGSNGMIWCPINAAYCSDFLCHESGHYLFGFLDEYASAIGYYGTENNLWSFAGEKSIYAYDYKGSSSGGSDKKIDSDEERAAYWDWFCVNNVTCGKIKRPINKLTNEPKNFGLMEIQFADDKAIEMSRAATYEGVVSRIYNYGSLTQEQIETYTQQYFYSNASCEEKMAHELNCIADKYNFSTNYEYAPQMQRAEYWYSGDNNVVFTELDISSTSEMSLSDSASLQFNSGTESQEVMSSCEFDYEGSVLNISSQAVMDVAITDFNGTVVFSSSLNEDNNYTTAFETTVGNSYSIISTQVVNGKTVTKQYYLESLSVDSDFEFNNESHTVTLYSENKTQAVILYNGETVTNGDYSSVIGEYTIISNNSTETTGGLQTSLAYDLDIDYSSLTWFYMADSEWVALETTHSTDDHCNPNFSCDFAGNGKYCLMAKTAVTETISTPINLTVTTEGQTTDGEVFVQFTDDNTNILNYNIYYSTEPITSENYANVEREVVSAGSNQAYITVDDIGATYYFAVQAVGTSGAKSEISENVSFTCSYIDSNSDGIPDYWLDIYYELRDLDDISGTDSDNDGLTNLEEYKKGTNPLSPDTDGDNVYDAIEVINDLDPCEPMTDGETDDYTVVYDSPELRITNVSFDDEYIYFDVKNEGKGKAMRTFVEVISNDESIVMWTANINSLSSASFSVERSLISSFVGFKIKVDEKKLTRDMNYANNVYEYSPTTNISLRDITLVKGEEHTVELISTPSSSGDMYKWSILERHADIIIDAKSGVVNADSIGKANIKVETLSGITADCIVSVIPFEGSGYTEFDCNIINDKTEVLITGYIGDDVNVTIPKEIGDYPVTSVADNAFKDCNSIKIIDFGDGIKSIGENAFAGCTSLEYAILHRTKIDDISAYFSFSEATISTTSVLFVGTGNTVTINGSDYTMDFVCVVKNDVNSDGVCDALDAAQVALVSNGQKTIDGAYKMAADSNSDDIVDIEDYQAIVNKVVA